MAQRVLDATPMRRLAWLLVSTATSALVAVGSSQATTSRGEPTGAVAPPAGAAATARPPADLARAAAIYDRQCASCHGAEGRGDGPAAYLLFPKPRDLRTARHRLVSTWEGVPTEDDLLRTITRGIPGSAMPSWGHLPDRDRRDLVRYVRWLSERPLDVAPSTPPTAGGLGTGVVVVPPDAGGEATSAERGRQLFADACVQCHGAEGRGDGQQKLVDSEGRPTRARDLTSGVFKTDPAPEAIYRRIVVGMPGTPMQANDWAYGDDAWALTRYVLSLSSPTERERAEMKRHRVVAKRVARVPSHPDDWLWSRAEPVHLHLMPLWWRYDRPEEVVVSAVHDGREVALLMVWSDPTRDDTAIRPQDFRDAAAVEFATTPDAPFFAMGEPGAPVNVWMWKAERQADIEPAFQDLEKVYPHLGIDSYPDPSRGALEQPLRNALTVETAPLYVTAWGAGNVVADPTRRAAGEDLRAEGFGTLRARPKLDRSVAAHGDWSTGSYRVVLRRKLAPEGADSVRFVPGATVPAAFAVWDGSAGDRDGKKSVTIWQDLALEK